MGSISFLLQPRGGLKGGDRLRALVRNFANAGGQVSVWPPELQPPPGSPPSRIPAPGWFCPPPPFLLPHPHSLPLSGLSCHPWPPCCSRTFGTPPLRRPVLPFHPLSEPGTGLRKPTVSADTWKAVPALAPGPRETPHLPPAVASPAPVCSPKEHVGDPDLGSQRPGTAARLPAWRADRFLGM